MTHARLRCQRGFTITELMVATTITGIFALGFYALVNTFQKQMVQQSVYYDTNRAARLAMDKISRDVKEAVSVVSSYGGNTTGDQVLILKLPSIDAAGEPNDIATKFDYVTYKRDGTDSTRLVRAINVDADSSRNGGVDHISDPLPVVVKKIETLLFSDSNGVSLSSVAAGDIADLESISVRIKAQGKTRDNTQSTQVESELMLRNKL